jgi:hypothetical protein
VSGRETTTPPTFALLPSPLLGSVAWQPVRNALRTRGVDAAIVDLPAEFDRRGG